MLLLGLPGKDLAKPIGFDHVERGLEQLTQLGWPQNFTGTTVALDDSLGKKQHALHSRNDGIHPGVT